MKLSKYILINLNLKIGEKIINENKRGVSE